LEARRARATAAAAPVARRRPGPLPQRRQEVDRLGAARPPQPSRRPQTHGRAPRSSWGRRQPPPPGPRLAQRPAAGTVCLARPHARARAPPAAVGALLPPAPLEMGGRHRVGARAQRPAPPTASASADHRRTPPTHGGRPADGAVGAHDAPAGACRAAAGKGRRRDGAPATARPRRPTGGEAAATSGGGRRRWGRGGGADVAARCPERCAARAGALPPNGTSS